MVKIVGVQFKGMGRIYYFDPLDVELTTDDFVVVETIRGLELGKVTIGNREVEDGQVEYELKPIIRKATNHDLDQEKNNNEMAEKNFEIFKKHVATCKLDMKPLYCEYTLDQAKIIFYYSANDRVDFRDLLKLLAPEFRTRVELRQIGSREAARIIGGLGSCGRELCCATYLKDFDFVTMKMAKEQSMSLNTSKISGACDKLMCCIAYESELYKELRQQVPGIGTYVKTPSCEFCKIVGVDYVKKMVKTQESPTGMPVTHDASKVEVIDMKHHKDITENVTTIEPVKEEKDLISTSKEENKENKDKQKNKQKGNQPRNNQPKVEKKVEVKKEAPQVEAVTASPTEEEVINDPDKVDLTKKPNNKHRRYFKKKKKQ